MSADSNNAVFVVYDAPHAARADSAIMPNRKADRNTMKNLIHHAFLVGTFTLNACATLPSAPAPAPAPAPSAANSQNTQIIPGYRRVMVNGEERFCRNDPYTGSRIQKEMVCYTAEQIKENEQNTRDFLNNVESQSTLTGVPQPAVGGAGR